MFGIGLPELILIMAVALIVVGPEKLPELAKTLAKQVIELKRAANALKDSLHEEDREGKPAWEQVTPDRPQIAEFTPLARPMMPNGQEGETLTVAPDTPPSPGPDAPPSPAGSDHANIL